MEQGQDRSSDQGAKIPLAGCPNCGIAAWMLQLDAFPPAHTKIVRFWCAGCKAYKDVNIKIEDIKDMSNRAEVIDE